jgi:hypothetical protein
LDDFPLAGSEGLLGLYKTRADALQDASPLVVLVDESLALLFEECYGLHSPFVLSVFAGAIPRPEAPLLYFSVAGPGIGLHIRWTR